MKFKIFTFAILCALCAADNAFLRIMTFNTWYSGKAVENGLEKILREIKRVDPDVVTLQEFFPKDAKIILKKLGSPWEMYQNTYRDRNIGILTKHKIIESSKKSLNYAIGAVINITNIPLLVDVWSLHLHHEYYGPYYAHFSANISTEKIIRIENSRKETISRLGKFLKTNYRAPVTLAAGDFNSPSHLDWIEETKHLHAGFVINWPATKLMMDYGFKDTYRELYPDVVKFPGNTWSPILPKNNVNGKKEPQDRIDFIFHKGLKPKNIKTYVGEGKLMSQPNHFNNDYPSDHAAVVAEFST